ncbi:hypothetical protein GCM10007276_07170 [Agaricicola taiwanensis]|uniref:AMP-dependent synthetase/ligase domain-containing protein n=1 Tax=Agaricicola taiwanensis TaxID=591372 RepID=A0A8J2VP48_9RHOB|nr:AMP-binding protein [Agaricicola taiwanensis]GGE32476.1 hypothetical protein GCM10007276_07170 [Agaricicola taiwanensis]
MKTIALADLAAEAAGLPQANVLFSTAGPWTGETLRQAGRLLPAAVLAEAGDVVLCLADPLKLALALFALHGRAERMVLISPATAAADAADLLGRLGPCTILSDGAQGWMERGTPVVWDGDVTLPGASPVTAGPEAVAETRWVFATSGTTGRPKLVEHSLSSLTRTAKRGRGEGAALRWGQLFELSRFAGIQVFLQGLMGGGGLVLPDTRWPLRDQLAFLAAHDCNALSGTPTLWRKILMTPDRPRLSLRQVTLGGEVADDAILQSLKREFPEARIVHIYASTEAGAAFSVKDGKAGFPASFVDEPPGGIRLKIHDDRLFVENGDVSPSYIGSDQRFADEEGFIDTGDVVERRGDRFLFRGRANGAINIGGNKLFPEEVERMLVTHPEVRLARVSARPNPITGAVVVAEVVPAIEVPDTRPTPPRFSPIAAHICNAGRFRRSCGWWTASRPRRPARCRGAFREDSAGYRRNTWPRTCDRHASCERRIECRRHRTAGDGGFGGLAREPAGSRAFPAL